MFNLLLIYPTLINVKKFMKKFLLPFIDKSFSFSPKKPFQILASRRGTRREVELSFLQNSNWRRVEDSNL
jgi:hypothetical protein